MFYKTYNIYLSFADGAVDVEIVDDVTEVVESALEVTEEVFDGPPVEEAVAEEVEPAGRAWGLLITE